MVLEFCYAVAGVFWVVASWSKSKELTPLGSGHVHTATFLN